MPTLLETIVADADARLTLPAGRTPDQELARFKTFLKVETHRLKIRHRAGAGGLEICQSRAAMMDALLRHMWTAIQRSFTPQFLAEFPPLALVAVGGYGRGQLNPSSDIDFMFLHENQVGAGLKALPSLSKIMDGILYPLWDLGLKIGYSVRTVEECVSAARDDMQSKTSLIEARLVIGSEPLFNRLQKAVIKKCVEGYEDKYIAARLEDQAARHSKHGNSPFMQEPNVKNGCGGLRDFQNLLWMAFFKYRCRSLAELEERGLLTASERKQMEAAYDCLLRVRNELHYLANRPVDVLSKNLQPSVASNLGFNDRAPSRRLEKFMRAYYMQARNIYLINRTLEQRLALQPEPRRLQFLRGWMGGARARELAPVDGFRFAGGLIEAANPRVFRDQPRRLMRVFLHAQQRGLRLHPDLAQLIRNQLGLADRAFLTDEHVRESFLAILSQPGNVALILRQMHEVGLLGKYLPEFGRLTCLVQHEFYHQYTADEHTLVCLEKLDALWDAREKPYAAYHELFRKLDRPFLLYLALLLHDVGKSDGDGRHAEASGRMAVRVSQRLKLDGAATHTLRSLIENHLLMASVSQRRDLDNAAVVQGFASQVQSPDALAMLTLHTLADTLATSDTLWNGFKDSLLWTLYRRTLPLLTGETQFILAAEKQRELLSEEIGRTLPGKVGEEELHAHFASLPPRYFEIHTVAEISRDLALSHRFLHLQFSDDHNPLEPVIDWHNEPDRGYTVVKICTWDREALFNKIAGSLSAAGLNILGAQIFTRSDYIALDSFYVTDARTGAMANREEREKFETLLNQVLTGGEPDLRALVARQKPGRPPYQSYEGDRLATKIRFFNDVSDPRTAMEVETEDRVGLLYSLSLALAALKVNISAAKIVTEKGAAIDTFYLTEEEGEKIDDPARQEAIQKKLRHAINQLAAN